MRTVTYLTSLVFIFVLPWEGVIQLPGLGSSAKILGLALSLLWVANVVVSGRFRRPRPFHGAVALFVTWNAVTVFWSRDPAASLDHAVTWVLLLVLVLILWDLYDTPSALLAGLQAYVLGAYVALGSAIANFLAGNAYYSNYERFAAGDTNPDGFGFLMVLAVPIAWYLASSANGSRVSGVLRIINLTFIPLALLGLALSGTRTALLAAVPAMLFGVASLVRVRPWIRVTIFLFFMASMFIFMPYLQTLTSFQRFGTISSELSQGDLSGRTIIWGDGLAAFQESPLHGVGSNMYRSINSLGKVAHNSFLSVLVEGGLIGFILFSVILMIVVINAWTQPRWERWLWLTMLAVWVIGASTLTWEYRKSTWLIFSFVIASAAIHLPQKEIFRNTRWAEGRRPDFGTPAKATHGVVRNLPDIR